MSYPNKRDSNGWISNRIIITLDTEFGGFMKDPYGNEKAGFSINGKLNRKDFGLNWNSALEAGGVMVGNEIKANVEIQFIKQVS